MSEAANESAAKACIEAILKRDEATLRQLFTPDAVFRPPLPTFADYTITGIDNVVTALCSMSGAEYISPRANIFSVLSRGDRVVVEWIISATIASSKLDYKNWYCFSFTFRNGYIHEFLEYADTAYGAKLLGNLPQNTIAEVTGR